MERKGKMKADPIFMAGLVIIIIGVVFAASAAYSISSQIHTSEGFHQMSHGEFSSPNLTMGKESILIVLHLNATENSYLVPSPDLSLVNESNIGTFAIPHAPENQYNLSVYHVSAGDNATLYANISGQYDIVTFHNSTPQLSYILYHGAAGVQSTGSAIYGVFLGAVMIPVGAVMVIVGFLRGRKRKSEDEHIRKLMGDDRDK